MLIKNFTLYVCIWAGRSTNLTSVDSSDSESEHRGLTRVSQASQSSISSSRASTIRQREAQKSHGILDLDFISLIIVHESHEDRITVVVARVTNCTFDIGLKVNAQPTVGVEVPPTRVNENGTFVTAGAVLMACFA